MPRLGEALPLPNKSAHRIEELNLRLYGVSSINFLVVDIIARCRKVQVRRGATFQIIAQTNIAFSASSVPFCFLPFRRLHLRYTNWPGLSPNRCLIGRLVLLQPLHFKRIKLYGCETVTICDFSPVIDECRQSGIRSVLNMSGGTDLMAGQ